MMADRVSGAASAALIDRIQGLLDSERAAEALDVLKHSGQESPAVRNAKGVCLMRLGQYGAAARIFADLVFQGGISVPRDVPTVFRTNYVTALLLENTLDVACDVLRQIPDISHPAVQRLTALVRQWQRAWPWWRRLLVPFGIYPKHPPRLDFRPGDLWVPEDRRTEPPRERAA